MKKISKLVCLLLAFVTLLTAFSCGTKDETQEELPEISLDFSTFDDFDVLSWFIGSSNTLVSKCDEGVLCKATASCSIPSVSWYISYMYRDMGYELNSEFETNFDSYVPFSADNYKSILVKFKTNTSSTMNLEFTCNDLSDLEGELEETLPFYYADDDWQYMAIDLSTSEDWSGRIRNTLKLRWALNGVEGDYIILGGASFYSAADGASKKAEELSGGKVAKYQNPTPAENIEVGYYVCTHEEALDDTSVNYVILKKFDNLEDAKTCCEKNKVYGARVANEKGEIVYLPSDYTLLECDLLRENKWVTDYCRTNGFTYGHSITNPAIDCSPKYVSCDRLVCWALYRCGFILQPYTAGVVVSEFPEWCEEMGFTLIENVPSTFRPGDVMLVRLNERGTPGHAFTFAGDFDGGDSDNGNSNRYDCGSDFYIQSVQPIYRILYDDHSPYAYVYHPVVTTENNIYAARYLEFELTAA